MKIKATILGTLIVGGLLALSLGTAEAATRESLDNCKSPPHERGTMPVCVTFEDNGNCTADGWECKTPSDIAGRGGAHDTTVRTIEKTKGVLENIVGWIQIFFYIVATLMIILAAWSYLTAGGDETKVTGAKNKVIYALVAIAIAVIAGGVVTLVKNFVG